MAGGLLWRHAVRVKEPLHLSIELERSVELFIAITGIVVVGLSHVLRSADWAAAFRQLHGCGRAGAFVNGGLSLVTGAVTQTNSGQPENRTKRQSDHETRRFAKSNNQAERHTGQQGRQPKSDPCRLAARMTHPEGDNRSTGETDVKARGLRAARNPV